MQRPIAALLGAFALVTAGAAQDLVGKAKAAEALAAEP